MTAPISQQLPDDYRHRFSYRDTWLVGFLHGPWNRNWCAYRKERQGDRPNSFWVRTTQMPDEYVECWISHDDDERNKIPALGRLLATLDEQMQLEGAPMPGQTENLFTIAELDEAADQLSALLEEHFASLPPEEAKARRQAFHDYTEEVCGNAV